MALGLFHFNLNYVAGDDRVAHRYCVQAVIPFLDTLVSLPELRLTLETAAWGLEFLDKHYPGAIRTIRSLTEEHRLELVCSSYAPTVWPAFAGRDLLKSVELADDVLRGLNLHASPIFFSQEAFFGPGLALLHERYPILLCKDDYFRYVTGCSTRAPAFRMGQSLVLLGANHLGNEAARRETATGSKRKTISVFHRKRIASSMYALSSSEPENISGRLLDGLKWYWYHLGNGHHFCTPAHPTEEALFFFDASWTALNLDILWDLTAAGYRLTSLNDFADRLNQEDLSPLPRIWEASWNPEKSFGMATWMGRRSHKWENASAILGKAWRSRDALISLEESSQSACDTALPSSRSKLVKSLWKQQLLAESSDPLGWEPTKTEVQYGLDSSEEVLLTIAQLCPRSSCATPDIFSMTEEDSVKLGAISFAGRSPRCEAVGSRSRLVVTDLATGLRACEVWFRHRSGRSGVRFDGVGPIVSYTPSGLEGTTADLRLAELPQPEVFLPCANGLISIDESLHVVRINRFGQVAAQLLRDEKAVEFVIDGPGSDEMHHWQFLLMATSIQVAVTTAERLNHL